MALESLTCNKWSEKSVVYFCGLSVWDLITGGLVPWGLGVPVEAAQQRALSGETPTWDSSKSDQEASLIAL